MISSRRLAREWALKILYQMDVGGSSLRESCESSLERLRMEFVQRGSGSTEQAQLERICLDCITAGFRSLPAAQSPALDSAAVGAIPRIISEAPGWQDARIERAFKLKFSGRKPPVSARPVGLADLEAEICNDNDSSTVSLTVDDLAQYRACISGIVSSLPGALESVMRRVTKTRTQQILEKMPGLSRVWDSTAEAALQEGRADYISAAFGIWIKVAQSVRKHTTDWLHVARFTVRLVDLVGAHHADIDKMLADVSAGWKLERQVAVDRNIVRLAAAEMAFIPEIPVSASINEAVELAKKFSTAESGRFVNGVLGALAHTVSHKADSSEALVPDDDELLEEMTDIAEIADLPMEIQEPV